MRTTSRLRTIASVLFAALLALRAAEAADVKVAVATNFADPIKAIAPLFERATGHRLVMSFGATGQIFAQIRHGAPFDVFLAADTATTAKAVAEGLAAEGSVFTYAIGRLALYSTLEGRVAGERTLRDATFSKIAIANPATAPYGAAAVEVMKKLGVYDALSAKVVRGQNIGQAYQFVQTGNAEVGFVALSQVIAVDGGSRWLVPAALHTPIRQDAVLLKTGERNPAARLFLEFLRGEHARVIIEGFGYGTGTTRE